jgi:hypothetical protein
MSQKVKPISISVRAEINLTADDWSLYGEPGRDEIAAKMNREIERLLLEGKISRLGEALRIGYKWGAMDSEGWHAIAYIVESLGFEYDKVI